MKNEIRGELRDLATQIEEQVRFYREIGVTDIGESLRGPKQAPEATLGGEADSQSSSPPPPEVHLAAQAPALAEQPALFAELATERPKRSVGAGLLPVFAPQDPSLEAIRDDIGDCTRCRLSQHRTNIVFGEGNPKAKLMFVGEGPGADEDASGRPFVGRAGQLLDKIIAAIGLRREEVYICNVVKCRPPGNRTPERDEAATCEQFLFRQLAFVQPKVIVALGSPAFQCLLRTRDSITGARGQFRDWNGIKVMPTFHPAYLLRWPDKKREVWEDMKKVRAFLDTLRD